MPETPPDAEIWKQQSCLGMIEADTATVRAATRQLLDIVKARMKVAIAKEEEKRESEGEVGPQVSAVCLAYGAGCESDEDKATEFGHSPHPRF